MARQKKQIIAGVTREQMEDAFGEYAVADARIAKIQADMDVQFTKIREKYANELAELQQTKTDSFEVMQVFATEHREELFSKRRSMETTHGIIGFRTGNPKLKNRKGFTWASVLELAKTFMPAYVRTEFALAKDLILADRDEEGMAEQLTKCGVYVDQDETFYVEPKKEQETA